MEETFKIIRIFVYILCNPIKAASSKVVTKYNTFLARVILILILSVLSFEIILILKDNKFRFLPDIYITCIIIVCLYLLNILVINRVRNSINSFLDFSIDFKYIEKLFLPYNIVFAFIFIISLYLGYVFKLSLTIIPLPVIIWYEIQIILNIKYRFENIDYIQYRKKIYKFTAIVVLAFITKYFAYLIKKN